MSKENIVGVAQYIKDQVGVQKDSDGGHIITSEALKNFGFTPEAAKAILHGQESSPANAAQQGIKDLLDKADNKNGTVGVGYMSKGELQQFASGNLTPEAAKAMLGSIPATMIGEANPYGRNSGRSG